MRVNTITRRYVASALTALCLAACDRAADPSAAPQNPTSTTSGGMAPDPQDTVGGQGIVADTTFSSGAQSENMASAAGNMEGALVTDEPTSAGLPNGEAPHAAHAILKEVDRRFLSAAIDSSTRDLALARLGFNKAKEPEVKLFAQRLMVQQQQVHDRLLRIAASQSADLPSAALPRDRQAVVNQLAQVPGDEFDTRLLDMLGIEAQRANIMLYERAVQDVNHPAVRDVAQSTLPALRDHLRTAQALQRAQASAQTANPMP